MESSESAPAHLVKAVEEAQKAQSKSAGELIEEYSKPQRVGPSKKSIRKALLENGLRRSFFTKKRTLSRWKNYIDALKGLHPDDKIWANRRYVLGNGKGNFNKG